MDRKFAILLSLGLAILCAFVYKFATYSLEQQNQKGDDATVVSCQKLLEEWPRDNYHLVLTDFQPGATVASYDYDQDDNWDLVYVALFPSDWTELGNNYRAVIVYFDDVKNKAELDERLSAESLDSQLWYTQQTLPSAVHSDLASQYVLMDFSRSVVLQGGFRPPNMKVAEYAVLGSYLGIIACGIVAAWNMIAMLLPKPRPHNFFNDDDDDNLPVTNRAGLPDF